MEKFLSALEHRGLATTIAGTDLVQAPGNNICWTCPNILQNNEDGKTVRFYHEKC